MASDAGPQMGTEPESVDAQKGTMKDVLARCLKKNIAQVCTLLISCAHCKEEFQLIANLFASIAGKLTSKITVVTLLMHA
jgi:hypothetical protein